MRWIVIDAYLLTINYLPMFKLDRSNGSVPRIISVVRVIVKDGNNQMKRMVSGV